MNQRAADFHRIDSRLRLTGVLTTRTALRIGSGGAGELDAADLPVLKDALGFPYIPGASLKGALRSTVESLVRAVQQAGGPLQACDPLAKEDAPPDEHGGTIRKACGHHEPGLRSTVDLEAHCSVCRLFGSHVLASHVRFCDAMVRMPAGDTASGRLPVEIRDGVAIDRDLKVVHGNQKYDFEVVPPGIDFKLELFVENPKPWLMGLLVIGFDQLHDGFTALGGFTSRGLGRVTIDWSEIKSFTARQLLAGGAPEVIQGDDVKPYFQHWREALAGHAGPEAA